MIILLLNIFYDQSIFPTAIGTEAFTLAPVDLEDLSSWDGMRIGQVTGGDIGPFSSIKLEIIFNPMIPGAVDVDFDWSSIRKYVQAFIVGAPACEGGM